MYIIPKTKATEARMRKQAALIQPATDFYTAAQVSELCGVSLRQLQWWDEKHILSPKIEQHKRLYTPQELAQIRRIDQLRKAGVSLRQVRKCLRFQYLRVLKVRVPTMVNNTLVVPAPRQH